MCCAQIVTNCCVFWSANACLCMLSHGQKRWKTLENYEKSSFFFLSLTWTSHVHERKCTFIIIFLCFWLSSTMRMHAQAWVCWSKYTTTNLVFKKLCSNSLPQGWQNPWLAAKSACRSLFMWPPYLFLKIAFFKPYSEICKTWY